VTHCFGKSLLIDAVIHLTHLLFLRLPTDGFLKAYDQHEDSVYSVAWSPSDIWVFASLSYDGRVVINRVPTSEKFKILGI
jgi:WD40 repeat protein